MSYNKTRAAPGTPEAQAKLQAAKERRKIRNKRRAEMIRAAKIKA